MEPPDWVSGSIHAVSQRGSGEDRGGKDQKSMFQNLKENESIYGITVIGPRFNPFISIGAHGATGTGIRGQGTGISRAITPEIGPEKNESALYGICEKGEGIYLITENRRNHPLISIEACRGTGLGIRGHFRGRGFSRGKGGLVSDPVSEITVVFDAYLDIPGTSEVP
jgi:hypothetical protein